MTVADARALATIFRNRAGNFLLVLTADFDRVDFVFVERIPVDGQTSTIGTPQPKVRPRTISVERRKPERVQLRVLRRFTWTEADAFAQYEKLLAAYSVAYWSEDHFNNRALFSDYFLKERLPNSPADFPEWTEDPKPAYKRLHYIYIRALSGLTGKTKESLRSELLEPVFTELGFRIEAGAKASDPGEPDYRMYAPSDGNTPVALCLAYPWDRFLDGKDDKRDAETPDHNPGQRVVSLLEKAEAPWIVVTNGRLWRLYSPRAQSRASNYYEIELDEALGQIALHPSGPAEGFRYFWLLFRRLSFEHIPSAGEAKPRSLLDRLSDGSQQYAAELGESLKERVFEQIFRLLAEGFIANIREREGRTTALSQERLDAIFQGVLTLLYRLLFLLYAEARDLLPVRETLDYSTVSISAIKQEIGSAAGPLLDTVADKLKKYYRLDSNALYGRLARLFGVVDQGEADLNVPAYNGGLFISKPRANDDSAEAAAARFLAEYKVPDTFLAQALDLLARDEDPKTHQLVAIDFKSLGVRQLGSIYEGLLEFRLRIAKEKKAIVKEDGREVYVSIKDLNESDLERAEKQKRIVSKGEIYLENDKGERKATGSYYTPDHIVNYIVARAVGPVVREKFDAMRQRLREAERWHRDSVQAAKAKGEKPTKYETGPAVENRWRQLVNELFDLKILDPAMGSGHFLVETVDYITDKALDFLNSFPWNPVAAHLEMVRTTILDEMDEQGITIDHRRLTDVNLLKRHVLKRCIYGVDLNPMAVELAKVSLWLHCFTLGAPLSFLDHHVRCGNSLIGVSVAQVEDELRQGSLFGSQFAGLLLATDLMRHVGELSDVTNAQVRESREEYMRAAAALAPFRLVLDVFTSQWFAEQTRKLAKRKKGQSVPEVEFLKSKAAEQFVKAPNETTARKAMERMSTSERQIAEHALRISIEKRPFHWELEFPEVFYGPRAGTERTIERLEGAGFDAVVGNPPYDVLSNEELGYDVSQDLAFYRLQSLYEPAMKGKSNLYKLFLCRSHAATSVRGVFSLVVPMSLLGDEQTVGIRRLLLERAGLVAIEAFPQKDDPQNRIFKEAKLATAVFVARSKPIGEPFSVITHPGRSIEEIMAAAELTASDLARLNSHNLAIPTCTQRDLEIASLLVSLPATRRLRDYCEAFQGEINETTDGKRGFTSSDPGDGPLVLRGSAICLYVIREASQGEPMYLREDKYLKGKPDSIKAHHHQQNRIGWQESSAQNNFRRIIAAAVPKKIFCNHKINYIPEGDSKVPLDFVLALLNSKLSDWFFRLQSTNAAVSHYQILDLPAPTLTHDEVPLREYKSLMDSKQWEQCIERLCLASAGDGVMNNTTMQAVAEMSRRVQTIEAKRRLKNRSERSHLAPESQVIQHAIDTVLFSCFGLSSEDGVYIGSRLAEML